jgi:hypothetical protein
MDTKIFLQGYDSKKSSNTSGGLNVQFKGGRRLLPLNDVAQVISQNDQYNEERESCNIIRLTCQVNPICSNVLHNKVSEIVKGEGTDNISFVNYGIGQNGVFNSVYYKPTDYSYWSSNTMTYLAKDDCVDSKLISTPILSVITSCSGSSHYTSTVATTDLYLTSDDPGPEVGHPTNSIRDTQLSRVDENGEYFVYHCGEDIFNNHLLRSKTFKTVCKMPAKVNGYDAFNTIGDMMRDVSGKKVVEKLYFPVSAGIQDSTKLVSMHLYEYDDIDTFEECLKTKLVKKYNGWLGFNNRPKIKSYDNYLDSDVLGIDRPIMYENGGNFIDMYPSRDLYSFVPKFNKSRNRIEKNWNYCITYPSSSYTPSSSGQPFSDIIEFNDGVNSLKAIYFDENVKADNGVSQLVIYGISKHGLQVGDYVNIYRTYVTDLYWVQYTHNGRTDVASEKYETSGEAEDRLAIMTTDWPYKDVDGNLYDKDWFPVELSVTSQTNVTVTKKMLDSAEVTEVVDDYIFTVLKGDVQVSKYWYYLSENERKDPSAELTIQRETNDGGELTVKMHQSMKYFYSGTTTATKYYIINDSYVSFDDRALKLSYKKVVNDIECDYYVRIFSRLPNFKFASADTSNEYEIYKNSGELISIYQDRKYEFENHVSRLAFAKNIYTDEVGEIVFTDDIDIANIKDNLGRPITSLYLTIIKNNKGYKEWYGYDYLSTWETSEIYDKAIEYSHCFGKISCGIETSLESKEESNIKSINTINYRDNINAGYNMLPYFIENTEYTTESGKNVEIAPNEVWYERQKHFYGDLCYYDNYNAIERPIQQVMHRFNTAQRESSQSNSSNYYSFYVYDEIMYDDYDIENDYEIKAYQVEGANTFREGYYYKPHYEIPIKTFDKLQTAMPDFLTIRRMSSKSDGKYQIVTLQQHFLSPGDKTKLYDKVNDKYYDCVTVSGTGDSYKVFTCKIYDENTENIASTLTASNFSDYRLFKMDNLNIPSYARILRDGTCRLIWRDVLNNGFNRSDDSVEEYPFTNGAFYINKRIDLYLRRQDPHSEWGLYDERDIKGEEIDISAENNYAKDDEITC